MGRRPNAKIGNHNSKKKNKSNDADDVAFDALLEQVKEKTKRDPPKRVEPEISAMETLSAHQQKPRGGMCNPELRDPMSVAISFMPNPAPFRGCCSCTKAMWNQAVYLEGPLPCPSARSLLSGARGEPGSKRRQLSEFMRGGNTIPQTVPIAVKSILESQQGLQISTLTWKNCPHPSSIPDGFLSSCTALKEAKFEDLPKLSEVGYSWMYWCYSLECVTLKNLPTLTSVGGSFLDQCSALTKVTFEDLPELTTVEAAWMRGCTALETVVIKGLPKLATVGSEFLLRCLALKTATFEGLPELSDVGDDWMDACKALESVTLKGLPKLTFLHDTFLQNCKSLKQATFEDLPELATVGDRWMAYCPKLTILRFRGLHKLSRIGTGFLAESDGLTLKGKVHLDRATCHEALSTAIEEYEGRGRRR